MTMAVSGEPPAEQEASSPAEKEVPLAPLLTLRDGLPAVVTTDLELAKVCSELAAGSGPTAIDAERASGYRYSSRAYLIQIRREGAGSYLIDPINLSTLAPLHDVMADTEWILHAASQDLACLAEVGLRPQRLFDTELAGRLLGYPRVGLATLTETIIGKRMRKEHSAVDWSTRPLPTPWLIYAALDVEVLIELRDALHAELIATDKWTWAQEEFEALLSFEPPVRQEAWRRTTGIHKVRGRRGLGAVRALWEQRNQLAQERDVTPTRILPDSAIIVAAQTMPLDRSTLLSVRGFHGRGAERYAARWVTALRAVDTLAEDDLPARVPRQAGPPQPRAWADKDPIAARRLSITREAIGALSEEQGVPVENLMTPDHLRRALWNPPESRDPVVLMAELRTQLLDFGARSWQIDLVSPVLVAGILAADVPQAQPEGEGDGDSEGSGGDNTV